MATERIQRQIDRLLDDAEVAVIASDWAAVGERARAVLAVEEANPDAQAFLKMAEANGVTRGPASQAEQESSPPPVSSALAPTLPSSFAGGRYAVRRFLGEGGRKRV